VPGGVSTTLTLRNLVCPLLT